MRTPHFRRLLLPLVLLTVIPTAHAIEFSFVAPGPLTAGYGNSLSLSNSGLALTASAWSTTGKKGVLENAQLGLFPSYGLGVCSRDEGLNCSSKGYQHTLDNKGADDLVLFRFSSPVSLQSLTLLQFGGDSDLSVWAGTGQPLLDGMAPSALGTAVSYASAGGNTVKSVDLGPLFTGGYDWLAVSAQIGQHNDYLKLRTLAVTPISAPVPEPGVWGLMLAGLALVSGFTSRKKRSTG